MREISHAAVAAVFALGLAAPAGAQDAGSQDAEAQEIVETVQTLWEQAFNAGDGPKAAETVFAEDALLMAPDTPLMEGRQAIGEFWQGVYEDDGCGNLEFGLIRAELAGDDTLIETGTADLECNDEQGQPMPVTSKFIHVWKKQDDGSWLITQDIWNHP